MQLLSRAMFQRWNPLLAKSVQVQQIEMPADVIDCVCEAGDTYKSWICELQVMKSSSVNRRTIPHNTEQLVGCDLQLVSQAHHPHSRKFTGIETLGEDLQLHQLLFDHIPASFCIQESIPRNDHHCLSKPRAPIDNNCLVLALTIPSLPNPFHAAEQKE